MELLNYSRQFMQQLQTLRKEGQFCDCTVLVGDTLHPAHKVVLAASSLLFKSLLESSDNISIDNAMVSSQEFFSLLDLAYMGRLPPGKHNMSRIITAADNLQMFDVAVGCKNVLDDLMKKAQNRISGSARPAHDAQGLNEDSCSPAIGRQEQTQTDPRESQKDPASHEEEGAVGLLSHKRDEFLKTLQDFKPWIKALQTWDMFSIEKRHIIVQLFEGDPGVDVVYQRLLDLGRDEPDGSAQNFLMLFDHMKNLKSELESVLLDQRGESKPDNDGGVLNVARSSKHNITHAPNLTDYLSGVANISELLERAMDRCNHEGLKEALLESSREQSREHVVKRLLSTLGERELKESSVLLMLQELQECTTYVKESKESADKKTEGCAAASLLRCFQIRLYEHNLDPQVIQQCLQQAPTILPDQREYLQKVLEEASGVGLMEKLISAALDGGSLQPLTVWRCLIWAANHDPKLFLLLQEIRETPEAHTLLHAETEFGSPAQLVAGSEKKIEEEEEEEEEKEEDHTHRRGKGVIMSHACQWCNKTFDYKCRLLKHRTRCMSSPKRVQSCTECSLTFTSPSALQQHMVQVHHELPAKRKKTQSVDCELCSKTFKHPSGLLYHRRTEHLDERPFSCEECGARFAATSSLKNHMRLHTGERPYRCKHCDMSFAVAAALSYHIKKKHAEGKMFTCQYCSAAFAQSIELTRHVRTHTGDKPYVCRECGKGFKQANGLSVHIQSSHNVVDPHDCQKCRVSFSSLEKLRDHIQEVHPKELHQCPVCNKILSTGAQLGKHMSVHVGSKPYSCKDCNKFYQTLSGLWYHNRTIHQDKIKSEDGHRDSNLLHCKTVCNRSSLCKHQITKHPETCAGSEGVDEKEVQSGWCMWRCVHCNCALSEQELQQHVSAEHVSQQGSVFCCNVCSQSFDSEPEFQQHFFTSHIQLVQEEPLQTHDVTSQMLNQAVEVDGSQQVFVAMGDGGDAGSSSGIVALNMEDLMAGSVTLICEET